MPKSKATTTAQKTGHKMRNIVKGAAVIAAAYTAKRLYDVAKEAQNKEKRKA